MKKILAEIVVGVVVAVVAAAIVGWFGFDDRGPQGDGHAQPAGPSRPDSAGTAAPVVKPAKAGLRKLNRTFYDDGANTITLTGLEVTRAGQLKVHLRYQNHSPGGWGLSCPAPQPDLQSSKLTLADGRRVYPTDTYCTAQHPGEDFSLAPGEGINSWGVFPAVPPAGAYFSLNWYGFDTVEGLKL
ncbi:hypothetical protein K7640_15330 [Micromonospora sp. PLK6-60]|uniref:hypothetical protein n=1 Tax=Micromonospora sp. PLK6-60 TaxID=2873383 RepID=UPI001CA66641|nr:hypothetical protein [Micromonospora sp. PLK6-60]MBY8873207.1 hypothetical protein [Micromonospora sp. PLK6-60]